MSSRDEVRLSKFLSLVLRHRPDEYGLEMDERGFVDFEALIDVLAAEDILGENAEDRVRELVEGSERRRFAIDHGRIRALYGHSSRIRLSYAEDDPPPFLFHGTDVEAARRVLSEGLLPAGRAFVHLSATEDEARAVGSRHSEEPVLIRVDMEAARAHGVPFHHATDLIWLSPAVPPHACVVPTLPSGSAPGDRESRPRDREAAPGDRGAVLGDRVEGGVRVVQPDSEQGFKRRTRKKTR